MRPLRPDVGVGRLGAGSGSIAYVCNQIYYPVVVMRSVFLVHDRYPVLERKANILLKWGRPFLEGHGKNGNIQSPRVPALETMDRLCISTA